MAVAMLIALLAQLPESEAVVTTDPWEVLPLVPASEIKLKPGLLDGEWTVSEGLRVDDLAKTDGMPPQKRKLAMALAKQVAPLGIRSVADFTLVKTKGGLNSVTVRLFVFDNAEKCRAWWEKKYEADGWEKHYEQIDIHSSVAVRSLEMNKTAIAFGNVWLTTHQIAKEGREHIEAANHVLKQLTGGKRAITRTIEETADSKGKEEEGEEVGVQIEAN